MKKIFALVILVIMGIGMTGCSQQTRQLRDSQTEEVLMLQSMKKQILMMPERDAKEIAEKRAKLETVNREIGMALVVQREAQRSANQQTSNAISSVVTGAAVVGGAAYGIHQLTK